MNISIFGFKLNLEILILIGIVYLILVIHTVCGCTNLFRNKEGMESAHNSLTQPYPSVSANADVTGALVPSSPSTPTPALLSTGANMTSKKGSSKKEGFVGANTNYGESSTYSLTNPPHINTYKWGQPSLVVTPGKPVPKAAQAIIDRPNQSLPLPEGQLSLFDNMPFTPECCPNTYSSSMGCACMNTNTYNILITRFGNNVPYSEY
jgi:hypothetical protein